MKTSIQPLDLKDRPERAMAARDFKMKVSGLADRAGDRDQAKRWRLCAISDAVIKVSCGNCGARVATTVSGGGRWTRLKRRQGQACSIMSGMHTR